MFVLMILFACSDKGEGIQEASVQHYEASSLITLEESGMEFEEGYWVRRTMNLVDNHIFEEFISSMDGTLITYTYRVDVEAKTFEIDFSDGQYSGNGTFVGEGLDWSSWSSTSTHYDGGYVQSEDSMDTQGVIQSSKVGYSSSDSVDWILEEELLPITQDEYEQEVSLFEE